MLLSFNDLEQANVPREWTGRIMSAARIDDISAKKAASLLGKTPELDKTSSELANKLSDAMRPMTNDQREEFLALLPEWSESLDDLANAVRML